MFLAFLLLTAPLIYGVFKAYCITKELPDVKTKGDFDALCKRHGLTETNKPVSKWTPSITIEISEEQYRRWQSYHDMR